MIYHYTSFDVLIKILEDCAPSANHNSLTFWASSAYSLNDPFEMQLGYAFLRSFIEEYEKDMPEVAPLLSVMPPVNEQIFTGDDSTYHLVKEQTPFVMSFTTDSNSIQMWTLYADRGCGVCIGFDEEKLLNTTFVKKNCYFNSVAYDKENSEKSHFVLYSLAKVIIDNIKDYYSFTNASLNCIEKNKSDCLKFVCPYVSAFIKPQHYSFENEARLLYFCDINSKLVHFRKGRQHQIIPYIHFQLDTGSVKKILLGPNIPQSSTVYLSNLLEHCGIIAEAEHSFIPFRDI